MKKNVLSFLLVAAAIVPYEAAAVGTVDLQGVVFSVDTAYHQTIGPGLTQSKLVLKNGGRTINAFVIDMDVNKAKNMRVKVEVGKDSCNTAEAITSIARRKTGTDIQYLAGINGDFFITSAFAQQHEFGNAILGYPNMSCVTDGMIVAPDMIDITSRENALIVGRDGQLWIDATDLTYTVSDNTQTKVVKATAINYPRRDNELMLYNRYIGNYTKTSVQGREITLRPTEGASWAVNQPIPFEVVTDWHSGQSHIVGDELVISCGPMYTDAFIDGLRKGDTVLLNIGLSLPAFEGITPDISEVCGGDVRILKENVTTTEAIRWINTPSAQYSRSLVGYSKDRSHIVLCAVDAGGGSSGTTYYESADLMRALGCYDALDLDGGGSTAIWSHSHGILNHLRDGSERAVGNGIFFVLDAPEDNTVSSIEFADFNITLPCYALYTPTIYGYNAYGQLVNADFDDFVIESAPDMGEIQTDGRSILLTGSGTHLITARSGAMTATLKVTIDSEATASPTLKSYLLDGYHTRFISLEAQVGDTKMAVSPLAYEWTVADPSVVSVEADGEMTGLANGSTTVIGTLGDTTITIPVTVEKPTSSDMLLFSTWNPSDWDIKGSSVKVGDAVADINGNGFDVTYTVSSTRAPSLKLSLEKDFYSCPDGISVSFGQDKEAIAGVAMSVKAANAVQDVSLKADKADIPAADQTGTLFFDLSEVFDLEDSGIYPLTFRSITFTAPAKADTFTLKFRGVNGSYSYVENGVEDIVLPSVQTERLVYSLSGNTVNLPFTADTVEVYSLAGQCLVLAKGLNRVELPGKGFYIIKCSYNGKSFVGRIALKK